MCAHLHQCSLPTHSEDRNSLAAPVLHQHYPSDLADQWETRHICHGLSAWDSSPHSNLDWLEAELEYCDHSHDAPCKQQAIDCKYIMWFSAGNRSFNSYAKGLYLVTALLWDSHYWLLSMLLGQLHILSAVPKQLTDQQFSCSYENLWRALTFNAGMLIAHCLFSFSLWQALLSGTVHTHSPSC